ncbi:MAG: UDP-N-acetylmuramoyl-tripeptide--D-alanyl-D-alanine ligase, partial [Planctomycetota bacterium]
MKECSIQVLAEVIEAEPTTNLAGAFTGVSTDSRTTQPGECFFAIVGDNFDGHDYVSSAFANGAVCAVVGKDISVTAGPGKCILRVRDTIKALGDFARWYRKELNFKVAAITGSVGKTTTREITYHVLSNHFRVVQSPGSFNNNIGLPLTILLADPQDQIIVAEIGSNHPGEISCLTRIALPDIAVITNIYPAHLEGFGNLNAIMREKLSICEGLPPDGILIVNAGFDELVCACREKGISFKTFGGSALSAIRAADITHTASESTFTIEGVNVLLPLPGPGNVENALAAWAVCRQFGLSAGDFARAAKTLPRMQMRSELLQLG